MYHRIHTVADEGGQNQNIQIIELHSSGRHEGVKIPVQERPYTQPEEHSVVL